MTVLPVAHVSTNAPLAQSLRATSTASTPTSAPSAAPALTLAPLAQSASNFQTQKNPKRLVPHRTGRLLFPAAPAPHVRPTIAAPPTKHRRPINKASPPHQQCIAAPPTIHRPSCPTPVGQAKQCIDGAPTMRRLACPTLVGQAGPHIACPSPFAGSVLRRARRGAGRRKGAEADVCRLKFGNAKYFSYLRGVKYK